MPPPLIVVARRRNGRVEFEADLVTLPIAWTDLRSADGHAFAAHASAAVRPVDRGADIGMFAERFLDGRDDATPDDVRRHFAQALAAPAADFAARHDAADLLTRRAEFETVLRQRLDAVAFGCGMEAAAVLSLTLDSPSWQDEQARRVARQRQRDDADHAATLAASLARVGPAHRMAAADQVALLPTLLATMPLSPVLLAAGPNVATVDAAGELRTVAAPSAVGPLRCVRRLDDASVAIGGTSGVAVLDAAMSPVRVLTGAAGNGRGYNAVARLPSTSDVVATHGDLGLSIWAGDGTSRVVATPGPARGLVAAGGRLVFAAGTTLCAFDGDAATVVADVGAAVVAVLPLGDAIVVVGRDGKLSSFDAGTARPTATAQLPSQVTAATSLEAGGLHAIVVADERGTIDIVLPDATPLSRVAIRVGTVKMIAVAAGRVFTVTEGRTSVTVWEPGRGDAGRTVNVLARTGHHVTDLVAG